MGTHAERSCDVCRWQIRPILLLPALRWYRSHGVTLVLLDLRRLRDTLTDMSYCTYPVLFRYGVKSRVCLFLAAVVRTVAQYLVSGIAAVLLVEALSIYQNNYILVTNPVVPERCKMNTFGEKHRFRRRSVENDVTTTAHRRKMTTHTRVRAFFNHPL